MEKPQDAVAFFMPSCLLGIKHVQVHFCLQVITFEKGDMYKYAEVEGFYGLPHLKLGSEEQPLPKLNVVVGTNSTGKTALLKLLYSFVRTVQESNADKIKAETHLGIRHSDKIGNLFFTKDPIHKTLVSREQRACSVTVLLSDRQRELPFSYHVSRFVVPHDGFKKSKITVNAIFIPAKEVLSILDSIALSREQFQIPEFDDSYYDLVKALRVPPPYQQESRSPLKTELDSIFEGSISSDREGARTKFVYQKGGQEYGMAHTAEGIKKIGMLSLLLDNGMIDQHTVLFIDEPETALHPEAQRKLIDFLAKLSDVLGIQIFMATHSYYVVNQLANVALQYNTSVNCVSLEPGTETGYKVYDLLEGMPHIPIMEEALAMQHQNLHLALAHR